MTLTAGKEYLVVGFIDAVDGDYLIPGFIVTKIGNDEHKTGNVKFCVEGTLNLLEVPLKENLWQNLREIQ